MIIFIDLDGKIVEANRGAVETYGYSYEELLSMDIRDLRIEEERESVSEQIKQAQSESIRLETIHRRRDGSTFPVDVGVSSAVIQDKPLLLGIVRDISERKRVEAILDSERRRQRAVLDALPVGVLIADASGKLVKTNKQVDIIWGGKVPHPNSIPHYSEYQGWWVETGEPLQAEDWAISRALFRGETVVGEMVHIQRFDGNRGTILNSAAPILDTEGRIAGSVAIQQDITELVNLREALEHALEVSKRESWRATALESIAEAGLSTLRLPELLNTLVARIANVLNVDACCVFVLDEEAGEFVAHAEYNVPGLIGCRVKMNEGLIGKVAAERHPVYVADAEQDPLAVDSCDVRPIAKTLLGVPLIARDRVVGVTRVQSLVSREFTEDEVHLLQEIADRVAMAVANARLHNALQRSRSDVEETLERERQFSLLLQRALLPSNPSIGEGYSVAVRYVPALTGREIGGDFYDAFSVGNNCSEIMIGDVSGKGLEAASLAAATRNTIHAFVHETISPKDVLIRANSVLFLQQPSIDSFVTVC